MPNPLESCHLTNVSNVRLLDTENGQVFKEFVQAAAYSLIQSPLNGAGQLADKVLETNVLPRLQVISPPVKAEFMSTNWVAQELGSGLATVTQFAAIAHLTHDPLKARLAASERFLSVQTLRTTGAQMALGATYGTFFTPVSDTTDNFAREKTKAALAGALGFGSMALIECGLKGIASSKTVPLLMGC